jgi:CubicO group peptidase (beta-lactamase class C family)
MLCPNRAQKKVYLEEVFLSSHPADINTEYLKGIQSESATFAPSLTPAYSNNGFELLGLIATRLAGVPFEEIFNESIVQPLKLQSTTYSVPQAVENGAIPVNETILGWNTDLGVAVP